MIIDLLHADGFEPKKKGHGDEWCSPCPACGGIDRFIIHSETNRYWCRQCGAKGDPIQYLRDYHSMGYHEAAEAVGKNTVFLPGRKAAAIHLASSKPATTIDRAKWRLEADKLTSFARNELAHQPGVQKWLAKERGITMPTAERFGLGWISTNQYHDRAVWGLPEERKDDGTPKKLFIPAGLAIPGPDRVRIRRDQPGNYGRYYVLPGSGSAPMEVGTPHNTTAVIVESEMDAILLAQESKRSLFIVAMGSTNTSEEHKANLLVKLADSPVVLVAFDSDKAGAKASLLWLADIHGSFRAPVPPALGKDFTEAYIAGMDLNTWVSACLNLVLKIGAA